VAPCARSARPVCPAICGRSTFRNSAVHPCLHPGIRLRDCAGRFSRKNLARQTVPTALFRSPPECRAIIAVVRIGGRWTKRSIAARAWGCARKRTLRALHGGLTAPPVGRPRKSSPNLPQSARPDNSTSPATSAKPRILRTTSKPLQRPYWSRRSRSYRAALRGPARQRRVSAWRYRSSKLLTVIGIRCHKAGAAA